MLKPKFSKSKKSKLKPLKKFKSKDIKNKKNKSTSIIKVKSKSLKTKSVKSKVKLPSKLKILKSKTRKSLKFKKSIPVLNLSNTKTTNLKYSKPLPPQKSILFVCTGNKFRSMIAEYCLKKMMGPNSNLTIFSAGIRGKPAVIDPYLLNELLKIGIDASAHKITPITKEILIKSDLIVAMSNDHKEALLTNFGINAPTFNEICFNISAQMPDIDTVTDVENRRNEIEQFEKETMAYIYLSMPKFIINMDKFLK